MIYALCCAATALRAADADDVLALAQRYHLEGRYAEAEAAYLKAGELDRRYSWAIIPLWDDQEKWGDIVAVTEAAPEVAALPDWILGPAAYAYWKIGNAERFSFLERTIQERTPQNPIERDHQRFFLGYLAVCRGDRVAAKKLISEMRSVGVLQMAMKSKKFSDIQEDIAKRLKSLSLEQTEHH